MPLGWGEPCHPWWGPAHWVGRPRWLGWGGPRVVNNVVIERKTVVHAGAVQEYENAQRPGGLVTVAGKSFGRQPVDRIRLEGLRPDRLEPVHGALPVERAPVSFTGSADKVRPPPKRALEHAPAALAPEPRWVPAPRAERAPPKPAPRLEPVEREIGKIPRSRAPTLSREPVRAVPRARAPERVEIPKHDARAVEPRGELPGEPANRVYRGRSGHERSSQGDARGKSQSSAQPRAPSPGLRGAPGVR